MNALEPHSKTSEPEVGSMRPLPLELQRAARTSAAGPAFLQKMENAVVQRSFAERLWRRVHSVDQAFTQTLSWQGLKLRLQSLRTGRPVAEVEMTNRVTYRVEQLFLIHRGTSQLLLHASDRALTKDPHMVAEMLNTIQDYTPAAFLRENETVLEEFKVGGLSVWIASGEHCYLVAVIRGNPPNDLRAALEQTLQHAQATRADALANFQGDATAFLSLRPELETCLIADYREPKVRPRGRRRVKILTAVVAGLIAALIFLGLRQQWRWNEYVARLKTMPGIVVTHSQRGWTGASRITGLRDPLAADPALIARQARVDPARIEFGWREYQATDPALALRRFEMTHTPPPTVTTKLKNSVLHLTGSAPYEWTESIKQNATKIPGIQRVADNELDSVFSPEATLKRFIDRFDPPEGVEARMGPRNRVVLWGEATHAWLARVRGTLKEVPGVFDLDDRNVVDLDLESYKKAKTAVESTSIDFAPDKGNLTKDELMTLAQLSDQARRCLESAKRLGYKPAIDIEGQADAAATPEKKEGTTRHPAVALREFLLACGLASDSVRVVDPTEANLDPPDAMVKLRVTLMSGPGAP